MMAWHTYSWCKLRYTKMSENPVEWNDALLDAEGDEWLKKECYIHNLHNHLPKFCIGADIIEKKKCDNKIIQVIIRHLWTQSQSSSQFDQPGTKGNDVLSLYFEYLSWITPLCLTRSSSQDSRPMRLHSTPLKLWREWDELPESAWW